MIDSQILARKSGRANIRASEGAGTTTLTARDNPWQVFNLSASRNVVLPSTDVKAGDQIILENQGGITQIGFDLVVQASNTSALTVANGINIDATIQKGIVIVEALIDAPTTPAHWRTVSVQEYGNFLTTVVNGVNSSSGMGVSFSRTNNFITMSFSMSVRTGSTSAMSTATGANLTRLYKTNRSYSCPIIAQNNSVEVVANVRIYNTGQLECRVLSGSWSGNCAFQTLGTDFAGITYMFADG